MTTVVRVLVEKTENLVSIDTIGLTISDTSVNTTVSDIHCALNMKNIGIAQPLST